jgi:hypothetical protein
MQQKMTRESASQVTQAPRRPNEGQLPLSRERTLVEFLEHSQAVAIDEPVTHHAECSTRRHSIERGEEFHSRPRCSRDIELDANFYPDSKVSGIRKFDNGWCIS